MSIQSNETTAASDENMSPWFPAMTYRPMVAGPWQCKMLGAFDDGTETTHMRWWNGEHWSFPLQPEHEDLDGGFAKPADSYFVRDEVEIYLPRFAWRGFNEDQEPL
jgi:hypothetical protein